jgi:cellulose synthase operon protein C
MKHWTRRAVWVVLFSALAAIVTGCTGQSGAGGEVSNGQAALAKMDLPAAQIHFKNAIQTNKADPEARFGLAKVFVQTGQFTEAEAEALRAIELGKELNLVMPTLMEILELNGKFLEVVTEARKVSNQDPALKALVMTHAGRALMVLKRLPDAKASFSEALALQPEFIPAKIGLLNIEMATGPGYKANRAKVDEFLAKAPEQFEVQVLATKVFRLEKQLPQASIAIAKSLAIKPYHYEQRAAMVRVLIEQKEHEEAHKQILDLFKLAPTWSIVNYLGAQNEYERENFFQARDYIFRVMNEIPNFLPGWELAAEIALRTNEFSTAELYAKKLILKDPSLLSGSRLLSMAYLGMNLPERALAVLEPLAKANTLNPRAMAIYGEALIRTGDRQKGIKVLDAAVEAGGGATQLKVVAANARISTGDLSEGLQILDSTADTNRSAANDLAIARSYAFAKRLDKAMELANRFVLAQPKDPIGPHTQGMILADSGLKEDAAKAFGRALALKPKYFPSIEALAQIDVSSGKLQQAKDRFTPLLEANPKDVSAYLSLARLSASGGEGELEVAAYYQKAREADPGSVAPTVEQARYYISVKKAEKAVKLLVPLAGRAPVDPNVLDVLATGYELTGDATKAITLLERELGANAQSSPTYYRIGILRSKIADHKGALANFQRSEALQPTAVEPKVGVASSLFSLGQRPQAYAMAQLLKDGLPDNPAGFALLGDFNMSENKFAEAVPNFKRAFELSQTSITAMKLYRSYLLSGKDDNAREFLRAWRDNHPNDESTLLQASEILLERQDWKETVAVLNEVLKRNPKSTAALNNAAIAVHHLKEAKALQLSERAFQLEPNNPFVMDTYGWILSEQGKLPEGIKMLKAAAEKAPRVAEIRLHLAQALLQSGDKVQAIEEAKMALANNPSLDVKAQALQMIR